MGKDPNPRGSLDSRFMARFKILSHDNDIMDENNTLNADLPELGHA